MFLLRCWPSSNVILGAVLGYEVFCGLIDAEPSTARRPWRLRRWAMRLAWRSRLTSTSAKSGREDRSPHWKGCALARRLERDAVFWPPAVGRQRHDGTGEKKEARPASSPARESASRSAFTDSTDEYRIMKAQVNAFPAGYFSQSAIEAMLNLQMPDPQCRRHQRDSLANFPY